MFAPVTEALAAEAEIAGGHAILDVATGPGEPALSVAAQVGPQGRVVGIDPVPQMVAAARRAAEQGGFTNTQFEVASADDLPLPSDSFDAVVSRFGVMFFPSPVDGVREMVRVLRPGRKLALAAWDLAARNPFFESISRVLDRHVDFPPPAPDEPDPFRFADPGKLRSVLLQAGVLAPSERWFRFTIRVPIAVEDFWTLRCEMSEKLRKQVAMLSATQLTAVKSEAIEALREYSTEGGMSFPAQVLIVSGTKSRPA
jgi:SAM-dependent methyltransferase